MGQWEAGVTLWGKQDLITGQFTPLGDVYGRKHSFDVAEWEALKEAATKEEILHLEMAETVWRAEAGAALKQKRRAIEHRTEKLLRMEEGKVKVYCRNEWDLESKQSSVC